MANVLNKQQIEEFRKRLMEEEKKLQKKIEQLKANDPFNDPDHANDNAAVDTDAREQMGHDTIEAQTEMMKKRLARIERAYRKMEKGIYGTCESCGKPIMQARLELVPETQYCVDCERRLIK